jgi:hypothetical protein
MGRGIADKAARLRRRSSEDDDEWNDENDDIFHLFGDDGGGGGRVISSHSNKQNGRLAELGGQWSLGKLANRKPQSGDEEEKEWG